VPMRVALEVHDVRGAAGDKMIDAQHLVTAGEQAVAEVRAEESRGAGDDYAHATRRPMVSYVKPKRASLSGSYRLRPSTINGRASSCFMRVKSGLRYSSHSVTIASASAPASAS